MTPPPPPPPPQQYPLLLNVHNNNGNTMMRTELYLKPVQSFLFKINVQDCACTRIASLRYRRCGPAVRSGRRRGAEVSPSPRRRSHVEDERSWSLRHIRVKRRRRKSKKDASIARPPSAVSDPSRTRESKTDSRILFISSVPFCAQEADDSSGEQ